MSEWYKHEVGGGKLLLSSISLLSSLPCLRTSLNFNGFALAMNRKRMQMSRAPANNIN